MTRDMTTIHMEKRSYDGYCVGTGVEYPGIIVWGKTDEELMKRFKDAIPVYEKALEKHGIESEPEMPMVEVIPIDKKDLDK